MLSSIFRLPLDSTTVSFDKAAAAAAWAPEVDRDRDPAATDAICRNIPTEEVSLDERIVWIRSWIQPIRKKRLQILFQYQARGNNTQQRRQVFKTTKTTRVQDRVQLSRLITELSFFPLNTPDKNITMLHPILFAHCSPRIMWRRDNGFECVLQCDTSFTWGKHHHSAVKSHTRATWRHPIVQRRSPHLISPFEFHRVENHTVCEVDQRMIGTHVQSFSGQVPTQRRKQLQLHRSPGTVKFAMHRSPGNLEFALDR